MSVNDFEKGMIAAAKPYEEVFKKQEEALHRVADTLNQRILSIGDKTRSLIDDMEVIQLKKLYDLNEAPIDILTFEPEEKDFIVAGLYTLSSKNQNEDTSPFQKEYIRSIQGYLGVLAPQTEIDLLKIRSFDSNAKQRAIMQVFMEYLFLASEDFSFQDDCMDIFASFSVTDNDRDIIIQSISTIYKAVGGLGLIDKYGFAPEEPNEAPIASSIVLEELIIEGQIFYIPAGRTKEYTAKEIQINSDINCQGALVLEQCTIIYNGNDIKGKICLGNGASLTLKQCTIIGNNNTERNNSSNNYLVLGQSASSSLIVENTLFFNCLNFAKNVKADIKDSVIRYAKLPLLNSHLFDCAYDSNSSMDGSLVESQDSEESMTRRLFWNYRFKKDDAYQHIREHREYFSKYMDIPLECSDEEINAAIWRFFNVLNKLDPKTEHYSLDKYSSSNNSIFSGIKTYTGCTFRNLVSCINEVNTIIRCQFFNCMKIVHASTDGFKISDCTFKKCADILEGSVFNNKYLEIKRCLYLDCSGNLVSASRSSSIGDCYFHQIYNGFIKFTTYSDKPSFKIKNCHFDGIYTCESSKHFIAHNTLSECRPVSVEYCEFKHCIEGSKHNNFIQKSDHYYGLFDIMIPTNPVTIIYNCPTLENINKEGYTFEDVRVWTETGMDEPIGSRLNEGVVGVPGVSSDFTLKD